MPSHNLDRSVFEAGTGCREALGLLYEEFSADVYGVALRLTASPADAEDVAHDVFAGLPEAIRTAYREEGRFRSWLLMVTTRAALMKLRRRKQRREARLSEAGSVPRRRADDPIDRITLDRAVEALPITLRTVFVLKSEGLSHGEIAEALGISEGASRARLCRAYEKLRRLLGGRG